MHYDDFSYLNTLASSLFAKCRSAWPQICFVILLSYMSSILNVLNIGLTHILQT